MSSSQPIGIFDSGIGGLTVASALRKAMPNESLIYFGDTAHLPYGDKSKESIAQYSAEIAQFLIDKDCKALIVACNTASAYGFEAVKQVCGQIPCYNVIDPVVDFLARKSAGQKVGIVGTKGTISSRIYPKKIKATDANIQVVTQATPLLAPMIEEGFYNNNISQTVINSYLSKKAFKNIQTLVLGCTHYPLIKSEVENYYDASVTIVDSAEVVARHVATNLKKRKKAAPSDAKPSLRFIVSDFTRSFEKSTR
ncbi:MAG: glutamate racemase, partial [Flavobacteriales bacterium]|nr:glutamate racemase [Flavobacteriales bacterium]